MKEPTSLVIRVHAPEGSGEPDDIFVFEDLRDLARLRSLESAIMCMDPIAEISAELMLCTEIEAVRKAGEAEA